MPLFGPFLHVFFFDCSETSPDGRMDVDQCCDPSDFVNGDKNRHAVWPIECYQADDSLPRAGIQIFQVYINKFLRCLTLAQSTGNMGASVKIHTMDLLWEKFQWILPLYMKPISFQSKASVVCSVTAAIFIDFCLKILNVFSQNIGQKTNDYLNSAEQIPRNWNVDQLSVLITSWDIT